MAYTERTLAHLFGHLFRAPALSCELAEQHKLPTCSLQYWWDQEPKPGNATPEARSTAIHAQSSTSRPGTRPNSDVSCVTTVSRRATAIEATCRSRSPIGRPARSSAKRSSA